MAYDNYFKQQATSAIRDFHLLTQDAFADIGNTYRAVLMQHTGWITSGRYHHMETHQDIAQRGAFGPGEGQGLEIGLNGVETPDPGWGGHVHMREVGPASPIKGPEISPPRKAEPIDPNSSTAWYLRGHHPDPETDGPDARDPEIEPEP